jgi:signal transduction histidine kinase
VVAAWWALAAGSLVLLLGTAVARALGARARLLLLLAASALLGGVATAVHAAGGSDAVAVRLWVLGGFVLLPVALALFPDDRPPAGLGLLAPVVVSAAGLLGLAYPDDYASSGLAALVAALLLVAAQWWRYEHPGGDRPETIRRALLWLALGGVPGPVLAFLLSFLVPPAGAAIMLSVAWTGLVACLVVGLVAPEAVDGRELVVAVAVHLTGAALVLAVFQGAVAVAEGVSGDSLDASSGVLGVLAGACAIGYALAVRQLRLTVDRLLFGDRRDPMEAASLAGGRLDDDPVPALRSLRESLALPYAALLDGGGRPIATSGHLPTRVEDYPLSAHRPALGRLVVGLRPGELELARRDRDVLVVVAPALGQLVRALELRRELAASRAGVVRAVEEERRRLRRDLHDGIGPRLTGVAYAADAALNQLDRDPDRTAELIRGLRADAGEAIAEVRRLVEGLRPPSLDQVGLEQALRQHGQHLHTAAGSPLQVDVRAGALPTLPAAVEVTAYRIVVEALTNAARHSGGDHAAVRLAAAAGWLCVEVRDNGRGSTDWEPGVGLTSMRERAELLGGTVVAAAGEHGGAVIARLPLGAGHGGAG